MNSEQHSSSSTRSRRGVKRSVRTERQLQSLEAELKHLRLLFQDTLESYQSRIEGELAQLPEPIWDALEEGAGKMNQRQQALVREMIVSLRKLKVKPNKGRRKDLKKIELLIDHLATVVEEWQWAGS